MKAAKQCIPLTEEKIIHDPFHLMKLANEALDKAREQEHQRLLEEGDKTLSYSKYLWLTGIENHSEGQAARFEAICSLKLPTGRAWSYKELLRDLWKQPDGRTARSFFNDWYRSVIHTRLEPMRKLARSLKQRLDDIVTYCTQGITNGDAEGINSKIISIKRRAGGYRNRENFKKEIFFTCGGLDLYPRNAGWIWSFSFCFFVIRALSRVTSDIGTTTIRCERHRGHNRKLT